MKKTFLRRLVAVLLVLGVALAGLLLAKDPICKILALRSLHEYTGLRAEIGHFKITFGSAAFQLRDLKLYNAPEFGGTLLADVPELLVDLDAVQVADGILHFRNLKLNLTELNVVKNAEGRLNLEGVEKAVREHLHRKKRKKGEKFELEFGGIDQAQLTLGRIAYHDLRKPSQSRAFDLAITDEPVSGLKTEEDLQRWAGTMLFRVLMQESLKLSRKTAGEDTPNTTGSALLGAGSKVPAGGAAPGPQIVSPWEF